MSTLSSLPKVPWDHWEDPCCPNCCRPSVSAHATQILEKVLTMGAHLFITVVAEYLNDHLLISVDASHSFSQPGFMQLEAFCWNMQSSSLHWNVSSKCHLHFFASLVLTSFIRQEKKQYTYMCAGDFQNLFDFFYIQNTQSLCKLFIALKIQNTIFCV